jgi:hypothetical protein
LLGVCEPTGIDPFEGIFDYGVNRVVAPAPERDSVKCVVQTFLLKSMGHFKFSVAVAALH